MYGAASRFFNFREEFRHLLRKPRNRGVARAVEIDRINPVKPTADPDDLFTAEFDNGGHGRVVSDSFLLHQPAPFADEAKTRFSVKETGKSCRGNFSQ